MAIKSSVLAAISVKAAAGGVAAALAVSGAAAATAATGSANPASWGQAVVQAVQDCKDQVRGADGSTDGPRNVGQCVSAFARQKGEQQRAEHAQGPKGEPASGAGQGKPADAGLSGQKKAPSTERGAGELPGGAQGAGDDRGSGQRSQGQATPPSPKS